MDGSGSQPNLSGTVIANIRMTITTAEGMFGRISDIDDPLIRHSQVIDNLRTILDLIIGAVKEYNSKIDKDLRDRIDKLSKIIQTELQSVSTSIKESSEKTRKAEIDQIKNKSKKKNQKNQKKKWKMKAEKKAEKKWKKKSQTELKKKVKNENKQEVKPNKQEPKLKESRDQSKLLKVSQLSFPTPNQPPVPTLNQKPTAE